MKENRYLLRKRNWIQRNWWKILREIFLFINIFLMLFPLFFMFLSATKDTIEISMNPFGFPESFPETLIRNIRVVMSGDMVFYNLDGSSFEIHMFTPFLLMLKNSFLLTVMSLIGMLIVGLMFGYAIGSKQFKGKMILIYFLLIIQTVPFFGYIMPLWLVSDVMHLLDSLIGVVPVYIAVSLPMAIILFQGFFQSFPKEIEEAAKIDGCGELKMFLKIVVPMSAGIIASLAIINFMGYWNEYAIANLMIGQNPDLVTINIGIMKAGNGQSGDYLFYQFTILALSALPNFIFFTIFQKRIMKGVTLGAVKG